MAALHWAGGNWCPRDLHGPDPRNQALNWAIKDFPSWANTWLLRKARLTHYSSYRRLRLCGWKTGERLKDLHLLGSVKRGYQEIWWVHTSSQEALHTSTCLHTTYKPHKAGWTHTEGAHHWVRMSNQPPKGLWWISTHSKCSSQKWVLLFKRCPFSSTTIKPRNQETSQLPTVHKKAAQSTACLHWCKKQRMIWQLSLVPGCWSVAEAFHPSLNSSAAKQQILAAATSMK